MDEEVWKSDPEDSDVRASSLGRVQRWESRNKRWSPAFEPSPTSGLGYCYFVFKGKRIAVHQLIARTFLGPCPPGHTPDHENRVRHDNRVSNLSYQSKAAQRANQDKSSIRRDSRAVLVWKADEPKSSATLYASITSAAKELGLNHGNLRNVAAGLRKKCYGLVVAYADSGEPPIDGEVFRVVRGRHHVSQYGRVKNLRNGLIFTPKPTPKGTEYALLGSGKVNIPFHVLVAEAWPDIVGSKPDGKWISVDHKDRDPTNNAASNLRWATQSQQVRNQTRKHTALISAVRKRAMYVRPPGGEWVWCESQHAAARYVSDRVGVKIRDGQMARYAAGPLDGTTIKRAGSAMRLWSFKTAASQTE
jgi:hypothetical protein